MKTIEAARFEPSAERHGLAAIGNVDDPIWIGEDEWTVFDNLTAACGLRYGAEFTWQAVRDDAGVPSVSFGWTDLARGSPFSGGVMRSGDETWTAITWDRNRVWGTGTTAAEAAVRMTRALLTVDTSSSPELTRLMQEAN